MGHLEVPKSVPVRFFLFPPSESRKLYEETGGPMQDALQRLAKKRTQVKRKFKAEKAV